MSRENLYRGKREDNGEWVYGRLLTDDIIVPLNQEFEVKEDRVSGCDFVAYQVDPDTIGQFTGLYDIKGTMIFEGDITQATKSNGYKSIVNFRDGMFTNADSDEYLHLIYTHIEEVIGNIHDYEGDLEKLNEEEKEEDVDLSL